MSMMTIELRKERNEARHQSTCIHMVTYCKTRWVRSRSPTMLSICLVILMTVIVQISLEITGIYYYGLFSPYEDVIKTVSCN